MDTRIKFLYLSEPDMIKAGVKNMDQCVEAMEDLLVTLNKGDYVMAGVNHNSHGAQVIFPDDPQFEGMPKNADDRRFMAMPAYLGGKYQMAGMKWYGSNCENKASGLPRSILMMMLNDKDTGAPLALMSANLVSCYRTGAIPGVGGKISGKKRFRKRLPLSDRVLWEEPVCWLFKCLPEDYYGKSERKRTAFPACI